MLVVTAAYPDERPTIAAGRWRRHPAFAPTRSARTLRATTSSLTYASAREASSVKPIVEIAMDCADAVRLSEFWAAALGYDVLGAEQGAAYLQDPEGRGPFLCCSRCPNRRW
jgi:hypothetical protein